MVIDRSRGVPELKQEPNDLLDKNPPKRVYQHIQAHKNDKDKDSNAPPAIEEIEVDPSDPRRATLRRYKHALAPGHVGSEENPSVTGHSTNGGDIEDYSVLSGLNPIGFHQHDQHEVSMQQGLGLLVLPDHALTRPSKKQTNQVLI